MNTNYLSEAFVFIVSTLFELYILIVLLRFLLQCVRADFYNPVSQLLVTLSNPPLRYLRRWLPGFAGVDWACVLLLLVLQGIELLLIGWITGMPLPGLVGLILVSLASLLRFAIYIFMFAVIIQVVISWVNPGAYNPLTVILYCLTDWMMRPVRRLVPALHGIDFSPWLVLVALQLCIILVVKPLLHLGYLL